MRRSHSAEGTEQEASPFSGTNEPFHLCLHESLHSFANGSRILCKCFIDNKIMLHSSSVVYPSVSQLGRKSVLSGLWSVQSKK